MQLCACISKAYVVNKVYKEAKISVPLVPEIVYFLICCVSEVDIIFIGTLINACQRISG